MCKSFISCFIITATNNIFPSALTCIKYKYFCYCTICNLKNYKLFTKFTVYRLNISQELHKNKSYFILTFFKFTINTHKSLFMIEKRIMVILIPSILLTSMLYTNKSN